jgi:hypothetical protein
MELRDFFTESEIRAMKERIVRETSLNYFLTEKSVCYEDGETGTYKSLQPEIKREIFSAIDKDVKEFVASTLKDILHKIVKEKVETATEKFTNRLCDQLDKITEKTNWYWSIKN